MSSSTLHSSGLDDVAAEAVALTAAVAEARADMREVSHDEMRDWLLKVANGDFAAKPAEPSAA